MAWPQLDQIYAPPQSNARPLWAVVPKAQTGRLPGLVRSWLEAHRFGPGRVVTVPDDQGRPHGIVVGLDEGVLPGAIGLGLVPPVAPAADYAIAGELARAELGAVAWGLGAYRHQRYKSASQVAPKARLILPANVSASRVTAIVEAVHFGRELIDTPASDMGPSDLEAAARTLADRHGAGVRVIAGEQLLAANFPMLHAVGRASSRAPRLIDLTWGDAGPRVTLVGKGICFDTGGLDLKTPANMLLMKKDMGGAAAVLALGHMLMATRQPLRLRILVAAAENAVGGNAFRPGDVLRSRAGLTVEIGNTDAEGRLVLADAVTLADEDAPDTIITVATLTGAARTAVGPDLTPFYTDDDRFAEALLAAGLSAGDPLWRMPFWSGYEPMLDSSVADMNNVAEGGFAGSIIAALFLRRFVKQATRFVHLDIYGWRTAAKALGPKGGEVSGARALFEVLRGAV
jgi:leucyl aminopeptidase